MKTTAYITTILIVLFLFNAPSFSTAQTNGQTVKGSVFDIESHEPLIGASIVLVESNPIIGATTGIDGNFNIGNVPLGRHTLRVSYIGYETATVSEIMVTSGKEISLQIGLKQNITEMDEVVILAHTQKDRPQNTMANVSARSFTVEETRRYAGGLDDPARLVSAYAGVSSGNIQDNSIIVRGNAPQGVAWRLEGVEIPTPHHFSGANVTGGGMVTLFSSQVMANSDFYSGAFPAEYGDALAAVFDMKLRTGNANKREHTAQLGILGIDLASEGPFSDQSDASYLFNYRYSTFGLLADLKMIETDQLFKYQDLSFKLNFPTSKAGVFSLWGIGGIDNATEPAENNSEKWEVDFDRITFLWKTYVGTLGLSHKIITGKNTYLHSTAAISGVQNKMITQYVNNDLSLQPDMDLINNSTTATFTSVLNHKFNARIAMRSGLTYKKMFYGVDIAGTQFYVPGTYRQLVKENGKTDLGELFTQLKYDITSAFSLNGGLHAGYFGVNNEITVEPRVGFRWVVHPNHAISGGYGLHSRPEELKMYLMEVDGKQPNKSLRLSKAHHIVLGYDWRINENLRFKAETYYQRIFDVPGEVGTSFSLINFKQDYTLSKAMVNNTVGHNVGIDLTLEKFLSNNYYYLLTASFFDSKYKAGDGVWHNTRYNKGYVANALFGREFFFKRNTRTLDLNFRISLTGGERYTPVLEEESIANQRIVTDDSRAFEAQYNPMLYLDCSIGYRINHRRASSLVSLQVKNALGTEIIQGHNYNFKTNAIQLDKSRAVIPSISYKIEF